MQIGGTGVSQQEAANSPLCFDKSYGVWWKLVGYVEYSFSWDCQGFGLKYCISDSLVQVFDVDWSGESWGGADAVGEFCRVLGLISMPLVVYQTGWVLGKIVRLDRFLGQM